MKKFLSLVFCAAIAAGCSKMQPGQPPPAAANTNAFGQKQNDSATVSSHSFETPAAGITKSAPNQTSSSESSSMAKPIDVDQMTADIDKADKAYKQNPKDDNARETLAKAYFVRAFALTDAAQYRAALGDFRKGLRLDPNDKEAKSMHDEILRIFASINREPPKEGEEPKPLPFDKKKT